MFEKLLQNKNTVTINFIGDSITQGTSHCHPEETYVARITEFIAKEHPQYKVRRFDAKSYTKELYMGRKIEEFDTPVYVNVKGEKCIDVIRNGVGGSTVAFALGRIEQIRDKMPNGLKSDLIIMMYGINDALVSDKNKYVPCDVFKENYKKLVSELRYANPEAIMIMVTTSPNCFLDEYIEKTKEVASEEGLPIIDLYDFWVSRYDKGLHNHGYGDWLSDNPEDYCHHSPLGAFESANFVYSKLKSTLNKQIV